MYSHVFDADRVIPDDRNPRRAEPSMSPAAPLDRPSEPDAALVSQLRERTRGRRGPRGRLRRSRLPPGHPHHGPRVGRRGGGARRAVDGRPKDRHLRGEVGLRVVALPDRRRMPPTRSSAGAGAVRKSPSTTCCPPSTDDGQHARRPSIGRPRWMIPPARLISDSCSPRR